MPLERDEDIYALLAGTRTIAMIGASDRPDRPSYGVMAYLQSRGYRVLPVNPATAVAKTGRSSGCNCPFACGHRRR